MAIYCAVRDIIIYCLLDLLKKRKEYTLFNFIRIAGVAVGVLLAERVRKKYGLDNFFARLSRTGDIDNNNPGEKDKA